MEKTIRQIVKEELLNEELIHNDSKIVDGHRVRISYNVYMDSVNINVIDKHGYPWGIERVPVSVAKTIVKLLNGVL